MSRQDFFEARANTETHLKVTEIFETVDGETSAYPQGGWSIFIRLQGCRVMCSWCDSRYTWDPRKGRLITPGEIMRCLSFSFVRKVTITGGEPMEQYGWAFRELLDLLAARHFEVSMETGGCDDLRHVIQSHGEVNFVVDYKMPAAKIVRPLVMPNFERLRCSDIVKFVVRLEEMESLPGLVKNLREKYKCSARMVFSPVWEQADVLPKFMAAARAFGFARLDIGLNLQLHKFLFPTVRDEEVSLIPAPR